MDGNSWIYRDNWKRCYLIFVVSSRIREPARDKIIKGEFCLERRRTKKLERRRERESCESNEKKSWKEAKKRKKRKKTRVIKATARSLVSKWCCEANEFLVGLLEMQTGVLRGISFSDKLALVRSRARASATILRGKGGGAKSQKKKENLTKHEIASIKRTLRSPSFSLLTFSCLWLSTIRVYSSFRTPLNFPYTSFNSPELSNSHAIPSFFRDPIQGTARNAQFVFFFRPLHLLIVFYKNFRIVYVIDAAEILLHHFLDISEGRSNWFCRKWALELFSKSPFTTQSILIATLVFFFSTFSHSPSPPFSYRIPGKLITR